MPTTSTLSPAFLKILSARGFENPEDIDQFLEAPTTAMYDPFLMKGMSEAVERIHAAAKNSEKILIHGDYDVDGITATAIVANSLTLLKIPFETFLPEREKDGYGVSDAAIVEAKSKNVSLIITADCGVTAHKPIQMARDAGIDVIVIDHHRIPAEGLPNANVILNPQQEDCAYPFTDLSAGGLALKLSQALLKEEALQFLDLAALSTVCDVAPLKDENRIIVKHGLVTLEKNPNMGLKNLAGVGGIKARPFNVGHLGFILGPRINACGRMSTPDIALRLLLTDNEREAKSLSLVLQEENKVRQQEERLTTKEAMKEVDRTFHFNRDRVIVVSRQGWHQGVVGIVAARLVDKYHRPSVVIAVKEGLGKGSGRSIKGFHLFNALSSCKDLVDEFGGHEQAAGLSVKPQNISKIREQINEYARENYDAEAFIKKTSYDMELSFSDFSESFVDELKTLEPHGSGNSRPKFLTYQVRVKRDPMQKYKGTYQFWVTQGEVTFEASWIDRMESSPTWFQAGAVIDLIYSIKVKTFQGIQTVILDVKDIRPTSPDLPF